MGTDHKSKEQIELENQMRLIAIGLDVRPNDPYPYKPNTIMITTEQIDTVFNLRQTLSEMHRERIKRQEACAFKDDLYRNAFLNRTVDLEEIVDTLTRAMLDMKEFNDV